MKKFIALAGFAALIMTASLAHATTTATTQTAVQTTTTATVTKLPGDTNKDNRISRDEFMAAYVKAFDRRDTNKDGFIDQAEQASYQAQQAELRAKRAADTETDAGEADGTEPAAKQSFFSRIFN